MTGAKAFAHNIEVKNADGVTIYYNYINYKELAVTYRGSSYSSYSNEYTGSVVIPETVTYNGSTYSVTSIGSDAFGDCSGLTSVTIGNSVTSIGSEAFFDCTGLTSVTIGNSVTSIDYGAFYGCSGLTSVTIPNSVTSIGGLAFGYCSGLTSVTIGNSVTSIGSYAFSNCSGLTSVTIPNSVTSIGERAFQYCSGLTSVTIGNSVTSIGDRAFYGCSGLTEVTSLNTTPPAIESSTFDETTEKNATLHVPEGCKFLYWMRPYWENFYDIQEDATTGIENVKTDGQGQQAETDAIYTVGGMRLNTTSLSDLPKGIYIVNGKKISVK